MAMKQFVTQRLQVTQGGGGGGIGKDVNAVARYAAVCAQSLIASQLKMKKQLSWHSQHFFRSLFSMQSGIGESHPLLWVFKPRGSELVTGLSAEYENGCAPV